VIIDSLEARRYRAGARSAVPVVTVPFVPVWTRVILAKLREKVSIGGDELVPGAVGAAAEPACLSELTTTFSNAIM
jgi:hypothetical protein